MGEARWPAADPVERHHALHPGAGEGVAQFRRARVRVDADCLRYKTDGLRYKDVVAVILGGGARRRGVGAAVRFAEPDGEAVAPGHDVLADEVAPDLVAPAEHRDPAAVTGSARQAPCPAPARHLR
ncbi:hypothetical protein ACFVW1_35785 [Streptomyces olivochromogenes]|uniref:hypothetical protein n=1 Tax=Streptomyces olivochromogenes TaxID=1963 RepID=UPI0036D9DB00